ncbi:hypothetical protein BCR35DRAFT_302124 [Leucosporidium creatinivorum]|uniref:Major facilitator superfamily (MFS) profile domain-containing protein n=1 Tax=Leucosporidium creatinivorum TaxID=106004 RepID=A0A1Y2FTS5_9BASI|nr:hypothetical protein BCR35DRAFT_302124 [Leucosporidium creatinivorum]
MFNLLKRTPAASVKQEEKLGRPPFFLRYRASTAFITLTVGLGILVDLAGYSLVVPVIPFRLEELGYTGVASKSGWLIAFALLFMMGAIILVMETASFTAMVISRVLQGVSGTAVWTLGLSLITRVPEHRVGSVMGFAMIGFSVGELIGPPVEVYSTIGWDTALPSSLLCVSSSPTCSSASWSSRST